MAGTHPSPATARPAGAPYEWDFDHTARQDSATLGARKTVLQPPVRVSLERVKAWQAVGTDAVEETDWWHEPPSFGSGWGLPLMTGHVGLTEGMN
jgi:hypothetical protein